MRSRGEGLNTPFVRPTPMRVDGGASENVEAQGRNCNAELPRTGKKVCRQLGLASRSLCASTRRRIFPDGDFGICSTNSTRRIFLKGATRLAT